jgi:hypothetical protein
LDTAHSKDAQTTVTLVNQLPSSLAEFKFFSSCYTNAVQGTRLHPDAKSIAVSLKWAAVALGLDDPNLPADKRWNLKRYVETQFNEKESVCKALDEVNSNQNARARIAQREAALKSGSIYWVFSSPDPSFSGNSFFAVPNPAGSSSAVP